MALPAQGASGHTAGISTIGGARVSIAPASPDLVDRATAAGITWPSTPSWDVTTADYDNDGDMDFSMSLHMRNAGEVRRNNGDGTFTRVAVTSNPATTVMPRPSPQGGLVDRHACAWADFDGNGLQDLYCAAGRYRSNRVKTEAINNELFLQISPGSFVDRATASGAGEACTRGRHVVTFDLNDDGWTDLFLSAQRERSSSSDPCNAEPDHPYNEQSRVLINRGENAAGTWLGFRDGPEWNVSQNNVGNRLALAWDYNRDGRPDLLGQAFAGKRPYLMRNTGTGFAEMSRSRQVTLPFFNAATVADLTGDGIPDLVYSDGSGFAYRAGTAGGVSTSTVRIGTISGAKAWSVAVGDVNGDGRLDVYGQVGSSSGSGNPDDVIYVRTAAGGWQAHVVPSAGGDANDVEAVTVGGRAQFVVLNGGNKESNNPGPIQVIAWAGP
ncbi:VCBS repeat-containing protein [Nocardioides sp. YIM 152588]|uniref:FG-GAP repeat domain-containing protein n=1 Tax=Nocardioides sp. YIM 152588 TaxID=3158259 RepID=UPI0032E4D057